MANQTPNKCLSVRLTPAMRAAVDARGGARFVREAVERQLAFEEAMEANKAIWEASQSAQRDREASW